MRYKKLFELSIFHEYYNNKICPDLIVEPTIECRNLLSGHRLILKNKVNGIVVIVPVNSEDKPLVEIAENLRFTFILKLKNKDFLDFTDINWKPGKNAIMYYYTNFILHYNNQMKASDLDIIYTKFCDLQLPRGQHILAIVDIENSSYLSKALQFGILAAFLRGADSLYLSLLLLMLLQIWDAPVFNQESEYKITFKAKKQKWRYYLVTGSVSNGDEVLINDDNKFLIKDNDKTREEKTKVIKFTCSNVQKTDPLFSLLQEKFPRSKQYLFISDSEIACQESGIKNIQLLNQKSPNDEEEVWIKHLPNPPNRTGIRVINALKYL